MGLKAIGLWRILVFTVLWCFEMHVTAYQRELLIHLLPEATLEKNGIMKKGWHLGGERFYAVHGRRESET